MPKLTRELDQACEPILDAAKAKGARVWIVSEYGHCNVQSAIEPNKILRKHGFLVCRDGPFGENIDFLLAEHLLFVIINWHTSTSKTPAIFRESKQLLKKPRASK